MTFMRFKSELVKYHSLNGVGFSIRGLNKSHKSVSIIVKIIFDNQEPIWFIDILESVCVQLHRRISIYGISNSIVNSIAIWYGDSIVEYVILNWYACKIRTDALLTFEHFNRTLECTLLLWNVAASGTFSNHIQFKTAIQLGDGSPLLVN